MNRFFRGLLWLLPVALLALGPGCFRKDVQVHEVRVPQMKTQAAADRVRASLGIFDTQTVPNVEVDLPNRVVRVSIDGTRGARRNIDHAIADAGFDANDLPGNPERRKQWPAEMQ